jgi:hypothetical protein
MFNVQWCYALECHEGAAFTNALAKLKQLFAVEEVLRNFCGYTAGDGKCVDDDMDLRDQIRVFAPNFVNEEIMTCAAKRWKNHGGDKGRVFDPTKPVRFMTFENKRKKGEKTNNRCTGRVAIPASSCTTTTSFHQRT